MGRVFLDHMGGARIISCGRCSAPLTNREFLESNQYTGSTGKAYLYKKAINLKCNVVQKRSMLTGEHFVRDIYCKGCDGKLGWMYEYAVPKDQRHKEGKYILEKAYIREHRP